MKILLVTDSYTHFTNGVAGVVSTLNKAYRAKGHDVRILTVSGDSRSHRDGEAYYMPSFPVPLYPELRMSAIHRHPYLTELIRWSPDIIHIHSEGSTSRMAKFIARNTGAPIVMTWHTDYAKYAFRKHYGAEVVRQTARTLMTRIYKGASIITVPSKKAQKIMESYEVDFTSKVIPNGIVLRYYQKPLSDNERQSLMVQYRIPRDRKILVIVARLSPEKNIGELVKYFPDLLEHDDKIHMLIVGTGPDEHHLHHLVEKYELEDHVTFTGFIPPRETYRYYKLGDVFLSASTFEMHSLTYLEAMACGLPLVCREDPCLEGVLFEGENGYRYNNKDEFIEKTLKVLEDDETHRKMGEKSLSISFEFSEQVFADRMLKLYQELVASGGDASKVS